MLVVNRVVRCLPAVLAAVVAGLGSANAAWPDRPIKFVVPFAAGGPVDVAARVVAAPVADQLGAGIVIENRPGAGGNIGISAAARAEPDGTTFLVVSGGFVVVGTAVLRRMRGLKEIRSRAVPVSATVIGVRTETRRDSEGSTRRVSIPTVRYTDQAEQVHEVDVDLLGAYRLSPGDRVDVVYDPRNPAVALSPRGGAETVVGVVGAFFALLGVVVFVAVLVSLVR